MTKLLIFTATAANLLCITSYLPGTGLRIGFGALNIALCGLGFTQVDASRQPRRSRSTTPGGLGRITFPVTKA